ncbi:hypothetical protein ACIBBE_29495 [Streptomyces sp. NPDC051644]|uniref:hypothetical protein n=1 Tax=Streptomyces sp. NPDC051644 TaxID=3365666 RepID=UPI0037B0D01A
MNGRRRGPAPVTSLPFVPTMLRPLPHPVAPFANETLDSYHHRLAAANQTEFRTMRNPSRWLQCPLNELERLEILSGKPRTTLLWALPELRGHAPEIVPPPEVFLFSTRAACDLCGERSGNNGQSIQVYIRGLHDNVCIRHRRWLSCGRANVFEQIDLSQAPEIVRAQRLLDRLERRHGAFALGTAYRDCERFWREIDRRALVRGGRDSVLERIYRPDSKTLPDRFDLIRSQRFHRAANFPQTAQFTKLIISLAQRPQTERRVAHLIGFTQIEFEQAFHLDHRPRGITLPWLRNGLVGLVEVVADLTHNGEPEDASS